MTRWTVIVPMRSLPGAKGRLAVDLPPDLHAELVNAIRADTLSAVAAATRVARVLVVGDAPGSGVDLVQHSAGLNGAVRDGAAHARSHWPADGIAALVGDLPALRPADLDDALARAGEHESAFVPDATGTGTTTLTARPGASMHPSFGPGSAARHAASATAVAAAAGLRTDVDTLGDLLAASELGTGPRTLALLERTRLLTRSP